MRFMNHDASMQIAIDRHPWEPGLFVYCAVVDGNVHRKELTRTEYERTVYELRMSGKVFEYKP